MTDNVEKYMKEYGLTLEAAEELANSVYRLSCKYGKFNVEIYEEIACSAMTNGMSLSSVESISFKCLDSAGPIISGPHLAKCTFVSGRGYGKTSRALEENLLTLVVNSHMPREQILEIYPHDIPKKMEKQIKQRGYNHEKFTKRGHHE